MTQRYDSAIMNAWRGLLPLTLAVMMGYLPLGAVFGMLWVDAGLNWYWAPLMSLLVYAGALQYLAVGMLAAAGAAQYFFGYPGLHGVGEWLVGCRLGFSILSVIASCLIRGLFPVVPPMPGRLLKLAEAHG